MSADNWVNAEIEHSMLRDRRRLRRLWRLARRSAVDPQGKLPRAREAEAFQQLLSRSHATVSARRQRTPVVSLAGDLPILAHQQEIAAALADHQVIVVSGETGSGKSTQIPKFCLAAGYGVRGLIGHTQPRRIAARSIASRLAEELAVPLGEAVGFKIRFTDQTRDETYIKLMTDGILLAETQRDRLLEQYEVIIIDEAHERSLNIDFLLGYLSQLLPRRPELKVIITSATIDAERFSNHFATKDGPAPFIEVSGRGYPVEMRYVPLVRQEEEDTDETNDLSGLIDAVMELAAIDTGHVLVFLPTERDIREAARRLRGKTFPGDGSRRTEIIPLYARLSANEQNRIFQPQVYRRVVLATNVAESSLTVPGIRYVVDTGTARISRYAPRSKVQRLPIEEVSRASADQRAGRCGRVAPGICVRLYSEQNYLRRPEYTTPEIQRTNLAAVILRAKALNLGRVEDFPFIDPPRPESIRDGYATLFELGAVDESQQLTKLGRRLSRFPVDPRIGRMILAADDEHCLSETLIIASALEVQDPRERPHDKRQHADQQHAQFKSETSDFLSFLNIWDFYHDAKERLSRSQLRRECARNFLSYNRMREWTETHRQLMQLSRDAGLRCYPRRDNPIDLHKALLTGFLSGVAFRSAENEYTGPGGVKFFLWPGSGLFKSKPSWCLVAELVETSRRYGRTVAKIDPKWIEPLAAHLVTRSYEDPHWHRKSGRVMVWESVSLFGMPIVNRRRIPYNDIDPSAASQIFVREGLAKQQLDCQDKFYRHNETVIAESLRLAAKTRRSDWIVDEYTLYRFYDERVPHDVYDMASLRQWLKSDRKHRDAIRMRVEDLLPTEEAPRLADMFPDRVDVGSLQLPLDYRFSPGQEDDGLTITVPADALGQLPISRMEWLVPGMLEEKIVALIRSLPKSIRRGLIPAPDTARIAAGRLQDVEGEFFAEVVRILSELAGERIPPDAFRLEKLPHHLRMNIRVVDADGQLLEEGRDMGALLKSLQVTSSPEVVTAAHDEWQRDGIATWDFGDLPAQVAIMHGGIQLDAFPTIVDQFDSVGLRLLNSKELSQRQSRDGVRRLYVLSQRRALHSQIGWLPEFDKLCVWSATRFSRDDLIRQTRNLLADRAFFQPREKLPRSHEEFAAQLTNAAERIGLATQDVAKLLPKIFQSYHAVRLVLEEQIPPQYQYAVVDIKQQLNSLLVDEFLVRTPWNWLTEFPRFLQAIVYRLERLSGGSGQRDQAATEEIAQFWQWYLEERDRLTTERRFCPHLESYRWMLEEYRVSCFAQPLGTSISVSAKRLEKELAKVV